MQHRVGRHVFPVAACAVCSTRLRVVIAHGDSCAFRQNDVAALHVERHTQIIPIARARGGTYKEIELRRCRCHLLATADERRGSLTYIHILGVLAECLRIVAVHDKRAAFAEIDIRRVRYACIAGKLQLLVEVHLVGLVRVWLHLCELAPVVVELVAHHRIFGNVKRYACRRIERCATYGRRSGRSDIHTLQGVCLVVTETIGFQPVDRRTKNHLLKSMACVKSTTWNSSNIIA